MCNICLFERKRRFIAIWKHLISENAEAGFVAEASAVERQFSGTVTFPQGLWPVYVLKSLKST